MSEASENPNSADLVQHFSNAGMVAELLASSAPHQRALMKVLAAADVHKINPVPLISGLAQELSTSDRIRVQALAEQITSGVEAVDALELIPNLVPPMVVVAFRLAREEGNLSELYVALLDRDSGNQPAAASQDDNFVPPLMRMVGYVFVATSIISFILLKVVPEFQKMMEEFGVEPPAVFRLFLEVCDTTAKLWFVPFLLMLCLFVICIPGFRRYFRRWRPLKWRQHVPSPAVNRRRTMALVIQSASPWQDGVARIPGSASLDRIFPRLSKSIGRIKNGQGEWESLSAERVITKHEAKALALTHSADTQAWLLRWFAADLENAQANRNSFWFRLLMVTIYVVLVFVVFLTCLAIFMTYLKIVSDI